MWGKIVHSTYSVGSDVSTGWREQPWDIEDERYAPPWNWENYDPDEVECEWCGSIYTKRNNCPNCGGPKNES